MRLGLIELINSLIPTQMEVQPGLIVAGMIQDTFPGSGSGEGLGRSPLYRLFAPVLGVEFPACKGSYRFFVRQDDTIEATIFELDILGELLYR